MILLTGATGFLGGALMSRLAENPMYKGVVAAVRSKSVIWPNGVNQVQVGDLLSTTDWSNALKGVDVVLHCAARVHWGQDEIKNSLEVYREVNVNGTLNLARKAAQAGVRRFIFISSIKVNGEFTLPGKPFTADDIPSPSDDYSLSKLEAELGLVDIQAQTGMELVIVRPPLVYGPGVKANFASMMRWLKFGIPLPLGAIQNQRSLVSLSNLVDLILTCIYHPAAANQILLVSDGEDVSTPDLLRRMGRAMGCEARLLPVPERLLRVAADIVGRADTAQRLCSSLQVDIFKTRHLLGWKPPYTLEDGLAQAAQGFKR